MQHLKKVTFEKEASGGTKVNSFINNLYKESSKTETQNCAVTYFRSGSALLDFYAQAGAMRNSPIEALELFKKAFSENNQNAIRVLFYLRDVRGGQGERDLFRNCLEWLGTDYSEIFEKIIGFVSEYGRWDDLFFNDAKCFNLIGKQLKEDFYDDRPSLLAKWLPTINASSPTTKNKAKLMAESLGLSEMVYRTIVRDIRKKIKLVESQMSANEWDDINYSNVPSQASRIYKNAFLKHDTDRYNQFIDDATKGEVKINAGILYPYQIYNSVVRDYSPTLEALWNQLPDYTQGKNALVVADVSGSMSGNPMAVSVSLALYFAERNQGQFKDHFITFSNNPTLQRIQGSTLKQKMQALENADWEQSTDLQKVFELILNTAVENKTPAKELPETIYIISDMEFNECCYAHTNFEEIKFKYSASGYVMPNLVFWNVNAGGKNLPVQKNEQGVALVSGFSPSIFKLVTENKTPEQVMYDTINSERYAPITI